MSHTEQFNRIMQGVNGKAKEKATQKKITPVLIGDRANMNELQASIAKCSIAANVVYLPPIEAGLLHNYADVRKAFLNAGAEYKRNTFIFPNDAQPYIDRLMGGESVNIKKEFQFFATPKALADEIAAFANVDNPFLKVLEPSAGQGALIEALAERWRYNYPVDYFELMDVNRGVLARKIDNNGLRAICVGEDFLKYKGTYKWDRIIANPPFNKNQDIDHIRKMYEVLNKGGRIVTIASKHWQHSTGKKETAFKQWLNEIGATVDDIEAGTFKESGTNIATCFIIIDK